MQHPIPTSAARPVEYTPLSLDAEAYRRRAYEELEQRRASLSGEKLAHQEGLDAGSVDEAEDKLRQTYFEEAEKHLAESPDFIERNYRDMKERLGPPPVFLISIPTSVERDQINSRLIQLGLTNVTQDQIRATMIDELFERDWGKGSKEANEAHAEELANFLDAVWMRQEAHDAAVERFQAQETERVLDEVAGAPPRARAEVPPKIITVRENARMRLLIDEMMSSSQRLRDLAAANMDFSRRNAMLLARMHVGPEIQNLPFDPPLVFDAKTQALTEESVMRLREKVPDTAWNELVQYIDGLYRLDGYEEGNSASPSGKPSGQNGSTGPNGESEANGGSSTTSSIEQAPDAGSATTIERSSGSSSELEDRKSSNSQTDGA
jgi:hypothetical protein